MSSGKRRATMQNKRAHTRTLAAMKGLLIVFACVSVAHSLDYYTEKRKCRRLSVERIIIEEVKRYSNNLEF